MPFESILFLNPLPDFEENNPSVPGFFNDLNLDQIFNTIASSKKEYNLLPFFYEPLKDIESILYRQAILKDLEKTELYKAIIAFASGMEKVRRCLEKHEKYYYQIQKQRWFLDAAGVYCESLIKLGSDLNPSFIESEGLKSFYSFITDYITSEYFQTMEKRIRELQNKLQNIQYALLIKENTIRVRKYNGEENYQIEVEKTFEKFKQLSKKEYLYEFGYNNEMNHIEAAIINQVARLFPEVFSDLVNFTVDYSNFLNPLITRFDREVQFYIGYLEYIMKFQKAGYRFCIPEVSKRKSISVKSCFDLALANTLFFKNQQIIRNNFYLSGPERVIVVTGPNQGGKTTFARTFGQLHYLGALGLKVPGISARLFLFDKIFTHFEKQEEIKNLRGKLQDDLIRFYEIFEEATSDSIFLINEIFTSTSLNDAIFLSKKILNKILDLDALCVCVTFIDELSTISEKTVSMVSKVDETNHDRRTFKIERQTADGLSYAISIAQKYDLTYDLIKDRMKS